MKKQWIKKNYLIAMVFLLVMVFAFTSSVSAAGTVTVKPSGKKNNTDIKRIKKAMKSNSVIVLKKGKKYYLASPIHIKSNKTIIADGAVITAKKDVITTDLKRKNYENVKNVTISGGVWKSSKKGGFKGTSLRFVHSSDITLKNMTIKHPSFNGHAVELVACKNVVLDKLKIMPKGKANKSLESMVQIDIATKATYPRLKGTGLRNGEVCRNVLVSNCSIKGNRAVASGYDYKHEGFLNKFHENIRITGNTLISTNAEGIFLANAKHALVKNNYIESRLKKYSSDKAIGLHYLVIGNNANTSLKCDGNTVKGGKYALRVYSQGPKNVGSAFISGNKCYCKKGAARAIQAAKKGINTLQLKNNKSFKW